MTNSNLPECFATPLPYLDYLIIHYNDVPSSILATLDLIKVLYFFYWLVARSVAVLDCEQSLFCPRTRARERRSHETRDCLALSVTRVAICVSRVLLDGLQKKERLLVVCRCATSFIKARFVHF